MSKAEFVYITYIETTPDKLFQALTDSEFSRRYWFGTELRSEWKVGAPFALVTDGNATDTGTVLEFDPPKRLSYTFKHERHEAMRHEKASRVTFVLEPFGKIVKLTLIHDDFPTDSVVLDKVSKGWPAILANLKSLLETGAALTIPFEALKLDLAR